MPMGTAKIKSCQRCKVSINMRNYKMNYMNLYIIFFWESIEISWIWIYYLFSPSSSRLNLRITRMASNNLKQLIKKSLEAILDECQYQQYLPSSINLPLDAKRRGHFSSHSMPQKHARGRCIRLLKILPFAKKILCWLLTTTIFFKRL